MPTRAVVSVIPVLTLAILTLAQPVFAGAGCRPGKDVFTKTSEADQAFWVKACDKAESVLKDLDPKMTVAIVLEKKSRGKRLVLQFRHTTNPKIFWNNVPFTHDDDFIETLPGFITDVYEAKKKKN